MAAAVVLHRRPPPSPAQGPLSSSTSGCANADDRGPPLPPSEAVYASLIRTYLDLLCYDNATFLAERCAASFPASESAIYLLAFCHYRGGSPKSARSVLLGRWLGRNDFAGKGGNDDDDGRAIDRERTRSSARYLLAKCCYDLNLYSEAEETLLRHCRESFARAVNEGGGTVNGVKIRGNRGEAMDAWIVQTTPCPVPNGSAGLHLLGNICRRTNRRQRAIEYYRLSLKMDPLMWTSYEALCELGGPAGGGRSVEGDGGGGDDPNAIFGVEAPTLSPRHRGDASTFMGTHHQFVRVGDDSDAGGDANNDSIASDGHQQQSLHSFRLNRYGTPSTPYTCFESMKIGTYNDNSHPQKGVGGVNLHLPATASTIASRARGRMTEDSLPQTNLFAATPGLSTARKTPGGATIATPTNKDALPPASAIGYADRVLDRARRVVAGLTYEPSPESIRRRGAGFLAGTPAPPSSEAAPFHAGVSTVKGEKRALFSTSEDDRGTISRKKPPKKEGGVGGGAPPSTTADVTAASGQKASSANGADMEQMDEATERRHVGKVLELLCGLGAAYRFLCQFRSQDALELLRELPPEQINTGWVQHQIGKAYFEMTDYQQAHRALHQMQKVEPHRIKGLDILSTTLWQLKKEVELSDLAQQVVDFDRMAPEAWFVVGNCFSLQKEHETAITFFRRAIQLNPSYTYAHTLCGHEYTSNEDFEKAISCYRDAIRVDCRHYNAWYGLGAIYFRQEKFDLAEYHFQRALDINSQSSVLHCHLGMAQHQNGKTVDALDTLAGAFRLDPRNPQAHYQRATIFMTLDRPDDALAELEKVRSAAPKEASVHFNMGKVHKRLGQPAKAMRCFLTALDLDPKDNNLIKAAMDRLDEPDVEEEVSVF
mmetsp:Transcript_46567/g.98819  ORF Transcript_46567/g.98819 Transcript_46567/m.98819 type:complete len:882 (-) Transcript_46567:263-2908(-)